MDHEYEADLLTLLDDEGQEHEFEIIDELENDDGHFLALVPTQQEPDEIASDAETTRQAFLSGELETPAL